MIKINIYFFLNKRNKGSYWACWTDRDRPIRLVRASYLRSADGAAGGGAGQEPPNFHGDDAEGDAVGE